MANGPVDSAGEQMTPWKKYELLAQELAQRLSDHFGADTEICEHNTKIEGRSTTNQIDVVWVGTINGNRRRIIIECKDHARPISQGLMHTFVSVLDDIKDPNLPTFGVYVTPVGYQSGAQNVAKDKRIFLLEVRQPTDTDVDGLILKITVDIVFQTVEFSAVQFDWVTAPVEETWPRFLGDFAILHSTSVGPNLVPAIPVQTVLGRELGSTLEEQIAAAQASDARIHVDFGATMTVEIDNTLAGTAAGASGVPQAARREANFSVGPGREGIKHVLKDALDGTTVWFTDDDKVRPISQN